MLARVFVRVCVVLCVLCVITPCEKFIADGLTIDPRHNERCCRYEARPRALVGIYPLTALGRSAAQMSSERR